MGTWAGSGIASSYDGRRPCHSFRPSSSAASPSEREGKNHGCWPTSLFLASTSRRRRFSWIGSLCCFAGPKNTSLTTVLEYGIRHSRPAAERWQQPSPLPVSVWLLSSSWSLPIPMDVAAAAICLIYSVTHLHHLPPPPMSPPPTSLQPPTPAPAAPTSTVGAGSMPGPPGTALPMAPAPTITVVLAGSRT